MSLTDAEFKEAAEKIGCDVRAIKAVCAVEAPNGGFNPDGSPVTLFEGHKFYLYTKGKYSDSNPTLCFKVWTRKFYGRTWQEEKVRLEAAKALDRTAALMSTSWGKFQIMGFNFSLCGFSNVEEFVVAMKMSEFDQLQAFVNYVNHTGLSDELRDHRWADFARCYNGADFRANKYDYKLAQDYMKENE